MGGVASTLKCSGRGALRSSLVAYSGVPHGDHSEGLETGFCRSNLNKMGDKHVCTNYRRVTILSGPGNVLARILPNRVRQKLLTPQRHEQSSFTHKSTVDRILALLVLNEHLGEFHIRLLAAYVDLREAFDSVNRDVL